MIAPSYVQQVYEKYMNSEEFGKVKNNWSGQENKSNKEVFQEFDIIFGTVLDTENPQGIKPLDWIAFQARDSVIPTELYNENPYIIMRNKILYSLDLAAEEIPELEETLADKFFGDPTLKENPSTIKYRNALIEKGTELIDYFLLKIALQAEKDSMNF